MGARTRNGRIGQAFLNRTSALKVSFSLSSRTTNRDRRLRITVGCKSTSSNVAPAGHKDETGPAWGGGGEDEEERESSMAG